MLRGDDHVGSQPKGEGSITPPDFSYTDLGNLIRKGKKIQEEEDAHIQAGPGTQGLKDDGAITKKGIEHPTGPQPPQEVKPGTVNDDVLCVELVGNPAL